MCQVFMYLCSTYEPHPWQFYTTTAWVQILPSYDYPHRMELTYINLFDADTRSPLFYACSGGHHDISSVLLTSNCQIDDHSFLSYDTELLQAMRCHVMSRDELLLYHCVAVTRTMLWSFVLLLLLFFYTTAIHNKTFSCRQYHKNTHCTQSTEVQLL